MKTKTDIKAGYSLPKIREDSTDIGIGIEIQGFEMPLKKVSQSTPFLATGQTVAAILE